MEAPRQLSQSQKHPERAFPQRQHRLSHSVLVIVWRCHERLTYSPNDSSAEMDETYMAMHAHKTGERASPPCLQYFESGVRIMYSNRGADMTAS